MRPAGLARRTWAGRTTLVAAALLAAVLAGCTAQVQLPDAAVPEKQGHPWTDTDAPLWVARLGGCGECEVGTESASLTLTLLHRDGAVLHATYGQGGQEQIEGYPAAEGNRRGLTFAFPAEHEVYRDEITAAWTAIHGEAPHLVRVHAVQALRIDPTEVEDVLRVIEHAVGQSANLGATYDDCIGTECPTDGPHSAYVTFGAPKAVAVRETSPGLPDDAWHLLHEQFAELQSWLERGPARPGTS